MRANTLLIILVVVATAISGCGRKFKLKREQLQLDKTWPYYNYDKQATGAMPQATFNGQLDVIWEFQSNDKPGGPLTLYYDELIYPGTRKKIKFLDRFTGDFHGYLKSKGSAQTGLIIKDSLALFASSQPKAKLKCINLLNRKTLWKKDVKDALNGSILIENTAIVSFAAGLVAAIDLPTGKSLWQKRFDNRLSQPPLVAGEVLLQPADKGLVYVLNPTDGNLIDSLFTGAEITGAPAFRKHLFIPDINGTVTAMDVNNGSTIWQTDIDGPIWGNLSVTDNTLLVTHTGGEVVALDVNSGELLWSYDAVDVIRSSPMVVNDYVLFGTMKRKFYCLSLEDGALIEQRDLKGPLVASPITDGERIYVADDKGLITCFGERHEETD